MSEYIWNRFNVVRFIFTLGIKANFIIQVQKTSKVIVHRTNNLETCQENKLMAMNREIIEKMNERLNKLNPHLKSTLSELKSLESTLTTSELAEATNSLEIQISGMEKCKSELEANQHAVNTDDKKNAEQRYQSLDALFRKRRRIAEEMIGAIHENCPMQKKALLVCRAGKMQGSLKTAPDTTKNTPFLSLLFSHEVNREKQAVITLCLRKKERRNGGRSGLKSPKANLVLPRNSRQPIIETVRPIETVHLLGDNS
uniref:Uncharacterized protein n=1 Tax=Ascaris lumbricoides TaxID=6252 RepID=A0A0M3HEW6_ASCLU